MTSMKYFPASVDDSVFFVTGHSYCSPSHTASSSPGSTFPHSVSSSSFHQLPFSITFFLEMPFFFLFPATRQAPLFKWVCTLDTVYSLNSTSTKRDRQELSVSKRQSPGHWANFKNQSFLKLASVPPTTPRVSCSMTPITSLHPRPDFFECPLECQLQKALSWDLLHSPTRSSASVFAT